MKITRSNLKTYLIGSQFLATGGGLPLLLHEKIFRRVLRNQRSIQPISLNDLSPQDVIISAYGVGDPSIIPENFVDFAITSFDKYKHMTGWDIKGIVPGEIGAEGLAFLVSQCTGAPVVDADLVGGRAAPEIQLDAFTVCDLSITPVLLMALNGKSIFLEGNFTAQEIEKMSRHFFAQNGSSGILVGYGISVSDFEKNAIQNTLTLAMNIGTAISRNDLRSILDKIGGKVLCKTVIKDVSLRSECGFLRGVISCDEGTMFVKNENMIFIDRDGKKWCAPDILIFLDKKYRPIHNACIQNNIGKTVYVIHAPAVGYWQSMDARKMWVDQSW